MARIDPVEQPNEEQAQLLSKSLKGPKGEALNVFRTLVHLPELMRRVNALGGYFFLHGEIPARDRELVVLRTAARTRCAYVLHQHRRIAAAAGLPTEAITALSTNNATYQWSLEDSALLAFVDELLESDRVPNKIWTTLNWSDLRRMELLTLIGYYRMLGGFLNGAEVELD